LVLNSPYISRLIEMEVKKRGQRIFLRPLISRFYTICRPTVASRLLLIDYLNQNLFDAVSRGRSYRHPFHAFKTVPLLMPVILSICRIDKLYFCLSIFKYVFLVLQSSCCKSIAFFTLHTFLIIPLASSSLMR
jgi:hypothetical protein